MNHTLNQRSAIKSLSRFRLLQRGLACGVALALNLTALSPSAAQTSECEVPDCSGGLRGAALDDSAVGNIALGANVEHETLADQTSIPFVISVDGVRIDQSGQAAVTSLGNDPAARPVERQRKADVDLSAVDIQVKFDGLDTKRLLNVSTTPIRRAYQAGETATFLASTNYPAFIERAEIRVLHADQLPGGKPVAVIPILPNGTANWVVPNGVGQDLTYSLRVYDANGRFDETVPLTIVLGTAASHADSPNTAIAPGMAGDRTLRRNIPVSGGAVTVFGRNVPAGFTVHAFGETIPLDSTRNFVVQRILPVGDNKVQVAVNGASKTGGLSFSRDINIPNNDWFYVALADLTVGARTGDPGIEAVRSEEYDTIYTKGRLAFYLKGKIKGEYLLTAAADTGEDSLDSLFTNLGDKDPRQLLRRIDPDDYYPVYGDDSSAVEDAPTSGKFYVRLERGDSHVMWGNYKTRVVGSEFMRSDRTLYGANAVFRSEDTTSFGERRTEIVGYAAQPGTLPQHDEFLATGGTAYFVKRQDVSLGSETITVEVRDKVSGRVLERRVLNEGEDYTFDYFQGALLLAAPLATNSTSTTSVRSSALGGEEVYLIAQYEYVPQQNEVGGYAHGGRAQHWINDRVRVGATEMSDNSGGGGQQSYGADIQVRTSAGTFMEAEIARSEGRGFGRSRSTDGGLSFSDEEPELSGVPATGWRFRGSYDLSDLGVDGLDGSLGGYYERRDEGFITHAEQAATEQHVFGVNAMVEIGDTIAVRFADDEQTDGTGLKRRDISSEVSWQVQETVKLAVGASHVEVFSPQAVAAGKSGYDGSRIDVGARVEYQPVDGQTVYGFAQSTVDTKGDIDRNDRAGIGGETRLTEKVSASSEASYGTNGWGGRAGLSYTPTAEDKYYLGYQLDPDRARSASTTDLSGADGGTIVAGLQRQVGENATAYAETSYDMFGLRRSLARTYGVFYTPNPGWTVDASIATGSIHDETIDPDTGLQRSDFDRTSGSLSVGYSDETSGLRGRIRGEALFLDSQDDTRDGQTYVAAASLGWNTNQDWRMSANIDAVLSHSEHSAFRDGDYIEASVGYAYRPTDNDRLNALFKYSYLYDLPGADQVSAVTGSQNGPKQRSVILAADANYDLLPWLTVGAKYGFRVGEVSNDRTEPSQWQKSSAHLAIARADLHVIKNWDATLEGRALAMPEAETVDYGTLVAVNRHVGEHMKVGLGYNFGRFSDDLRDLVWDDQGLNVNVVGKY